MPCSWLTANLEPVDQDLHGNHHKAQPGKHPEAIHEREELALPQEFTVDNCKRGCSRVCVWDPVLHERLDQTRTAIVQCLRTASELRSQIQLMEFGSPFRGSGDKGYAKAAASVAEQISQA